MNNSWNQPQKETQKVKPNFHPIIQVHHSQLVGMRDGIGVLNVKPYTPRI